MNRPSLTFTTSPFLDALFHFLIAANGQDNLRGGHLDSGEFQRFATRLSKKEPKKPPRQVKRRVSHQSSGSCDELSESPHKTRTGVQPAPGMSGAPFF
jgi:hypothetical protein